MTIDYGTDIDAVTDLPLRFTLARGKRNLGNALARRLTTQRGALEPIGGDPNYGLDVRGLLNDGNAPTVIHRWQTDIAKECEKDERVQSCICQIIFAAATSVATITLSVFTADDAAPFTYVLAVSALTVTLMEAP